MDTSLRINGQQNYQVWQDSQQPQQFWSSNTYPQYSGVNSLQSGQFISGYGAYYSGQTSNHQTKITPQQLPTNTVYSHFPNNFVHENTNLKTSYNDAQTRTFPHQWQGSICQNIAVQDPNWSNQRPQNMTAQSATPPLQSIYLVPNSFPFNPQQSVQTTVPQNAYKESNMAFMQTSNGPWGRGASQSATHRKEGEATRNKEDARKNQPPPPYIASTTQKPRPLLTTGSKKKKPSLPYTKSNTKKPLAKRSKSMEHHATLNSSSGQLCGSQTHPQLQSGVGKAPASSNSSVYLAPPSNNTQLSPANNGQLPQTSHLSVNPCHADGNPPPGNAILQQQQKAVAVVQPLSQKSNQVTTKKSYPEMIGQPKDTYPLLVQLLLECDYLEKNNGICSGVSSDLKDQLNSNIEPTNDGILATSNSTVKQFCTNAMQATTATLPLYGNGNQSEAPQSVTKEASQGREVDKSEVQESELDNIGLLSLIPVISWTYDKLKKLIAMYTRAPITRKYSEDAIGGLVKHFWDNDFQKLKSLIKTDYYKDLMTEVIKFCNGTNDSHVLSQVAIKNAHRLKEKFTVLDHKCTYAEPPYVSPWLNINKQLDDIDKEFGFPSCLKNDETICNTGTEPIETEPMETHGGVPVDIVKELAIKKVPPMAPALDVEDVIEDVESLLQGRFSLSMVPEDVFTADLKDPLDLLEIDILPPDQARDIFEQLQNDCPLIEFIIDKVITTEEITRREEFCCINRWIEVNLGTENLQQCCCKSRLESEKPCVIPTDALLESSEENIIEVSNPSNPSNPMQSNPSEISKIIDLAEELEGPQKVDYNLPNTPPLTRMGLTEEEEIIKDILSTIYGKSPILQPSSTADVEMESKPACPTETLNVEPQQPQDHDADHATAQRDEHHITEPSDNNTSAPEAVLNMDQKQSNGDLLNLQSISSSLTPGSTRVSPSVEQKDDYSPSLKKRLGASRNTSILLTNTSKRIIKKKVNANDSTTAAKNTVKLVLFGSLPHESGVSVHRSKSQTSILYSGRPHPPPAVLTLKRSPVKHRLCEEWRKTYLPIAIKQRKNHATESLPVSPEQIYLMTSVKKKRGRRRSTANDLTLEPSKMTKKRLGYSKIKSKSLTSGAEQHIDVWSALQHL